MIRGLAVLGIIAVGSTSGIFLAALRDGSRIEGDRRVLKSPSGYQTVSMLDGGRTGLYYDVGEEAGRLRPGARRVVLLGLGGGEMLRAARRSLPDAELVGVDINPKTAAAAISDFGILDLGVQVVVADAFDYIAEARDIDILMVDLFDDSELPARFRSADFFRTCLNGLSHNGLLVMNVWPSSLASGVVEALNQAGFARVRKRQLIEGNVMVFAEP